MNIGYFAAILPRRCLIFCIGLLTFLALATAQTTTRNTLRGQVIDQTGAGIAAAKITLTTNDQPARVETTDREGRFVVTRLTDAPYRVRVEAVGFAPYESDITRSAAPLKITLAVDAVKANVEVRQDRQKLSTEASSNANAIVLRENVIRRLPRDEEQLRRVLERMAGAMTTRLDISVNGMRDAKLPPPETIKEIRINSDPFSAAYHEPGSARVEIETKSGAEQVQAGSFFRYRHQALDARNAFAPERPPLQYRDFGGWWSSKLFNPRSFLFANYERQQHDEVSIVNAFDVDGPFYDTVPLRNRTSRVNLRFDFTPSDRHTFSAFYDFDHTRDEGLGINTLDLPERSFAARGKEQTLRAAWRSILSPRLVNEAQIRFVREAMHNETDNYDQAVEVVGAFISGGAQCCPEQRLRHQLSLANHLSYNVGRHFFKFGGELTGGRVTDDSERNFGGSFTFSSLTFFRLRRPVLYTLNEGESRLQFNLWNFAGYVQDDIKLASRFTLSPGLRYEAQTQLGDHNNVAPRLSFAWSPFANDNTVVRGGGGMFYQELTEPQLGRALRFDGVRQREIIIHRPRYPDPFGGRPAASFPISVNRLAGNLRTPFQWHSSLGIEQRLPKEILLTVTYNFVRGLRQFRARDINAPLETGFRPQTNFFRISQLESSAISTARNLAIGFSQTLSSGVSIFANYTYGRTTDDTDGPDSLPMNNYQLFLDRGFSSQDIRHQFFASAYFTLPWSWEVGPMVYFNTGTPYSITTGLDDNNDTVVNDRPTGVARNTLREANFASVDLRLSRHFGFGRHSQNNKGDEARPFGVEFAIEATNLFNRVNLTNFTGIQTSPFFQRANAAREARQLTLHFNFNLH